MGPAEGVLWGGSIVFSVLIGLYMMRLVKRGALGFANQRSASRATDTGGEDGA
jgi:hypothetical protein